MFEQYKNLPGHEVILLDGGFRISEPQVSATGETVLILGTAVDGPLNTPIRIRRPLEVEEIFGTYVDDEGRWNGANLVLGFNQAYAGGARSIYLMRINGKYAELSLTNEDSEPQLLVRGRYPGAKYNGIAVEVTSTHLNIYAPGATAPTATYRLSDYPSYAHLLDAVNADQGTHGVVLSLDGASEFDAVDLATLPKTNLSGGDDELNLPLGSYDNPDTYRGKLAAAYDIIRDLDVSIVVPRGVYVTVLESGGNFVGVDYSDAQALADLLYYMNKNEHPATGVIGVSRLNNPTHDRVAAFADCLVAHPPKLFTGEEDSGRYLSIVAAEPTFFDTKLKMYADTGATLYAGIYSALPTHHATTNTQVPGTLGMRYSFSLSKLDALTGAGFVTFRNRRGMGLVVTDDPTAAQRDSDYRYLSTVRIVNEVIDLIRQVGAPYTGKPVGGEKRNALKTDIQVALESMMRQGKLIDFDFEVRADIRGYVRGELDVELELVPAFILRRLRITVALRPTTV